MTELQKKFKKILADLEKNLKNKEDLEYVKTEIFKIYTMFLDEFDKLEQTTSEKLDNITAKYSALEEKMAQIDESITKIEKDIYIGEEYDLEIVCPYCHYEFMIDESQGKRESILCPECNNVIDLDWNEEEDCGHDCHECHHDCDHDDNDDDEDM